MGGTSNILGFSISVAALWHVMGFAFGLVYVWQSIQSLLGRVAYDPGWGRILKNADYHLWLSGITLIVLGVLAKGSLGYLMNPKLWCKTTVVLCWMLSTQAMRLYGVACLKKGNRRPMIHLSAINISCWVYGALLGCAKPLGGGVISYPIFLAGFAALTTAVFFWISHLSSVNQVN